MKITLAKLVSCVAIAASAMTVTSRSDAERNEKERSDKPAAEAANPDAAAQAGDAAAALSAQDQEVLNLCKDFAREVTQVIEQWVSSGTITEEQLFSRLYYPIADTDPTKFHTDYDSLAERDFPNIQEKYLSKASTFFYAIVVDTSAYVPIHNRQFSQPLSGNKALDFNNNRSKRFFTDVISIISAKNTAGYLRQTYQRDTGELVQDLTVPVKVRGKHWGSVRIGYRRIDK